MRGIENQIGPRLTKNKIDFKNYKLDLVNFTSPFLFVLWRISVGRTNNHVSIESTGLLNSEYTAIQNSSNLPPSMDIARVSLSPISSHFYLVFSVVRSREGGIEWKEEIIRGKIRRERVKENRSNLTHFFYSKYFSQSTKYTNNYWTIDKSPSRTPLFGPFLLTVLNWPKQYPYPPPPLLSPPSPLLSPPLPRDFPFPRFAQFPPFMHIVWKLRKSWKWQKWLKLRK